LVEVALNVNVPATRARETVAVGSFLKYIYGVLFFTYRWRVGCCYEAGLGSLIVVSLQNLHPGIKASINPRKKLGPSSEFPKKSFCLCQACRLQDDR
jgi:hypothetical protein